ncbi:MAG TPA: alpha/beta fold hydrolase [Vicinamibacterales bacterium]|nr:alpha/beta fold hydrolase [Vicinamibacterales bacterium]
MAHIALAQSPLASGRVPVRIRIRDRGGADRPALFFLHGGWGYEIYPFDRQTAALADRFRIVIPDRCGYGGSTPIDSLPADFHARAATETMAVVDALGPMDVAPPILWGHSDGAIIALLIGLASPDRIAGIVIEAAHYVRRKPSSRAFFEAAIANPDSLGAGVAAILARDHGERWRDVLSMHGRAWLRIGDEAASDAEDFYGGRLDALRAPVLVVHGGRDPRTEPGELDALTAALRRRSHARTDVLILADGGHSLHSERATADQVTAAASGFCASVSAAARPKAAR